MYAEPPGSPHPAVRGDPGGVAILIEDQTAGAVSLGFHAGFGPGVASRVAKSGRRLLISLEMACPP